LLFYNQEDPFQLYNLVIDEKYQQIRNELEVKLSHLLAQNNDQFLPGLNYVEKWNYVIDETGTIPYVKTNYQGLPIIE
jgi:hypothetical protein